MVRTNRAMIAGVSKQQFYPTDLSTDPRVYLALVSKQQRAALASNVYRFEPLPPTTRFAGKTMGKALLKDVV